MQGTQIATLYMNDQLKEEIHRDELVTKGKMTRREAEDEGEEWAEVRRAVNRIVPMRPFVAHIIFLAAVVGIVVWEKGAQ